MAPDMARSNRAFHQRAAVWMAQRGIRQFLDLGAGLPTRDNTHEVVKRINPGCLVIYVDNDPEKFSHARALLSRDDDGVAAIGAGTCVTRSRSWVTKWYGTSSTSMPRAAC